VVRLAALLLLAAAAAAHAQGAPGAPRTVTVTADARGRLVVAPSIPSGPVTLQLVNRAGRAVSAQLYAVREDHTAAEAAALIAAGGRFPEWIAPAGGVGPVAAGGTAGVTHSLPPGAFVVASTVPDSTGMTQARRGAVTTFTAAGTATFATVPGVSLVVQAGRTFRTARVAERGGRRIELVGTDRGRPLTHGDQVIELETTGGNAHEVVLVRMDSTATLRQYAEWFARGQRGRGPGRPAGGAGLLSPGRKVWLRVRLEPGTYWLYCATSHGGRHGWETAEYVQIAVR
jgi:hypothetical protein